MTYIFLFFSAFIAWLVGTITAGGAAIIFLLMLSLFLPMTVVPILISFVGTFAGVYRTILFRKNIYWPILKWLLPGTIIGSCLGATLFAVLITRSELMLLEFLLSFVLFSSGILGLTRVNNKTTVNTKTWLFLPFGCLISMLSGVIGAAPPIVNVLYQKFRLTPTQLVGTKSINLFTLQLTKSIIYIIFIFISHRTHAHVFSGIKSLQDFMLLSLIAGLGAAFGISFGKRILAKINMDFFRKLINSMLILFGCYFLILALVKAT